MEQRIALVSGANRGIGKEITRQLADQGWLVFATGRLASSIQAVATELGPNVVPLVCDVCRLDQCALAAALIESRCGRLDVLINNAGIIGNRPATAFDLDQIRDVMDTNLFGAIHLTRAMWPLLVKSDDARIINMSSGMGSLADQSRGDYAAYRMSKWGLNGWTLLLAGDTPANITVNAMCPGWVKTDMGGLGAARPVEKGAETAVWLATEPDIPTGKFWRDKSEIPW